MAPKEREMKMLFALPVLACILLPGTSLSDPPPGKGGDKHGSGEWRDGKGKGSERKRSEAKGPHNAGAEAAGKERSEPRRAEVSGPSSGRQRHFEDRQRTIVREYFVTEYRAGRCPPGLAKKHNGCMPPGQAKKWRVGQPLAREIVYYDLPPALVVRIGAPPPGYRYVRVAADILLIAVGTGLVIDAIADLGSL
jgi:hypothetical protein